MQRLILMRHGEAERPRMGLEDFDRALNAEGRAETAMVARALREAGWAPELVLVSAARRAVETWRAAASAAFPDPAVEEDRSLYGAPAAHLAAAVRDAAARAGTVMLVGHNPGIHQYAIHLARQSGASGDSARTLYERFPTGAAAVFAAGEDGAPVFEGLFLPRAPKGGTG